MWFRHLHPFVLDREGDTFNDISTERRLGLIITCAGHPDVDGHNES
jgi:hypothetical protein